MHEAEKWHASTMPSVEVQSDMYLVVEEAHQCVILQKDILSRDSSACRYQWFLPAHPMFHVAPSLCSCYSWSFVYIRVHSSYTRPECLCNCTMHRWEKRDEGGHRVIKSEILCRCMQYEIA